MTFVKIKLLKDWHSKKIGDIINLSKKGADSCIAAGFGELVQDKEKDFKETKTEEIIEKIKKNQASETDINMLENWLIDKKKEEPYRFNKAIMYLGDKLALINEFLKIQPIFYDKMKIFWIWNFENFCWEQIDEIDLMNFINQYSNADTIKSNEKNEILEAFKQKGRQNTPEPIKETWVQFKDKIIDVKNGEEFKSTPKYFATNPIPWPLNKNKFIETPNMDKIFEEWVGKENIRLLYEILAYCILPDYPIHRLFCFIGSGSNGKSCFLRLLRKFIGEYNCCSTELDTLITSRFEVTKLHKKLVCQMGETNFNEISKTSILKKMTGQDMVGMEYKNKTPFDYMNYAKIIIATNSLPTTTDKTLGFYRRWLIIDFPNQFGEVKEILEDIPDEEYEILAVKCCFILKDLLEIRKFTNEGSMEERRDKYESKSNFLEKFLNEFTERDEQSEITVSDFNKRFISWCIENRHRVMSEITVSKEMKKLNFELGKKHFDWMYDGKGGSARVFFGIKWK
jgi:P4 family phage/plasmid primase-like protien